MDIENYIKDLSPDLQEKARACGSVGELLALAKEAKIPLPEEALAAIAGGAGLEAHREQATCPQCGRNNVILVDDTFVCLDCGNIWSD